MDSQKHSGNNTDRSGSTTTTDDRPFHGGNAVATPSTGAFGRDEIRAASQTVGFSAGSIFGAILAERERQAYILYINI
jgi:hypothetical protein